MLDGRQVLVLLHVLANLLWIGAISAVGVAISSRIGDARTRGAIGRAIYTRLAMPAFLISFVAGTLRLVLDPRFYLVQTKFMHGKLLFAVGVIVLHHVIGAMARRLASGQTENARHAPATTIALVICAALTACFAVLKPF